MLNLRHGTRAVGRLVAVALVVSSCGGSGGATPETTVPVVTTAATTLPSATTTLAAASTTLLVDRWEGDLAGCVVGAWVLDVEAFERDFQEAVDPRRNAILVDLVSGAGGLEFDPNRGFTLYYDDLTFTVREPVGGPARFVLNEMVVTGEVAAAYRLDGVLLALSDFEGPGLVIRQWTRLGDEEPRENRYLWIHPLTLAMSPDLMPTWYPGAVALDCDEHRLVVSAGFDTPNVDVPPPTSWLRQERDD